MGRHPAGAHIHLRRREPRRKWMAQAAARTDQPGTGRDRPAVRAPRARTSKRRHSPSPRRRPPRGRHAVPGRQVQVARADRRSRAACYRCARPAVRPHPHGSRWRPAAPAGTGRSRWQRRRRPAAGRVAWPGHPGADAVRAPRALRGPCHAVARAGWTAAGHRTACSRRPGELVAGRSGTESGPALASACRGIVHGALDRRQ